ncbi:MAG: hydroxymethylglutaryl-CoA lyase [Pseudomonadota bacterium]
MSLPRKVKLVEVGPRDGLQNEPNAITVEQRVKLINMLGDAGFTTIEAGSFVSPKWVPRMAGSDEVLKNVDHSRGISYCVLTPNQRGYEDAVAASANEIAVFTAASETFSKKNTNCSIAEGLARFEPICADAKTRGIRIRGYISCVIDCPYEGEVLPSQVENVARALFDFGCDEISLGDTIGTGTPQRVEALLSCVGTSVPIEKLAVHFHDTYGQAVGNILRSLQLGVSIVDSAVAGLGGCPYAKGATGNVASEDVLYLLDGLGIASGISMEKLLDASEYISGVVGREPASNAARALLSKRH